jgi:glycine oxidase
MARPDAIVVGGGVIGCAVAWALAREGLGVLLLERDRLGEQASRAAAGMLAPLAELEPESPLRGAGLESLERFPGVVEELRELSGIDPELRRVGNLRAAFPDEAPAARARALATRAHECVWLEREEARKREPRLAEGISGAIWSPREAHVNSRLLTLAFAGAAVRRGAELRTGVDALELVRAGERIAGVRTPAGELSAAAVVLCAGAWTRPFQASAGIRLPVEPIRGQMLRLESPRPPLGAIVWGHGIYLVPRDDGTLLAGATVEEAGFEVRNTAAGLSQLLRDACALLPVLGGATFLEAWAGLRPATPDRRPLIGPVPGAEGLWLAAGHFRNGVLLAPFTAERLAAGIARGERPADLAPFDPARFGRV